MWLAMRSTIHALKIKQILCVGFAASAICYSTYIALVLPLYLVHAFQEALLLLIDGLEGGTAAHWVVQVNLTRLSTLQETPDSQYAGMLANCNETKLFPTKSVSRSNNTEHVFKKRISHTICPDSAHVAQT